jgi:hypothetical protein
MQPTCRYKSGFAATGGSRPERENRSLQPVGASNSAHLMRPADTRGVAAELEDLPQDPRQTKTRVTPIKARTDPSSSPAEPNWQRSGGQTPPRSSGRRLEGWPEAQVGPSMCRRGGEGKGRCGCRMVPTPSILTCAGPRRWSSGVGGSLSLCSGTGFIMAR